MQNETYDLGFRDRYELGARPLRRAAYDVCHPDYIKGYNDGYRRACEEADSAFAAQYSMDG